MAKRKKHYYRSKQKDNNNVNEVNTVSIEEEEKNTLQQESKEEELENNEDIEVIETGEVNEDEEKENNIERPPAMNRIRIDAQNKVNVSTEDIQKENEKIEPLILKTKNDDGEKDKCNNCSNVNILPTQHPKSFIGWIFYPIQMVLAVFVATVLIANVCGTPVDSALLGAGLATILYECITGFKSPMFVSSCGATCSAVLGALVMGNVGDNYVAVAFGGCIITLVYLLFAVISAVGGTKVFTKIFPPIVIGPVTMLIGLILATYLPTYIGSGVWPMVVALVTMLITALCSHYFKGFFKSIAFLIGVVCGYGLSYLLTYLNVCDLVHIGDFSGPIFTLPDLVFTHWNYESFAAINWIDLVILFVPVSICAMLEHYSDHKTLSNIIGGDVDLTEDPGLPLTLVGDGLASGLGTIVCGLPNTSYGESIAVVGFSKVASTVVTFIAAAILVLASFLSPVRVVLESIPSCVFGGCAMILYGYISASGLKTLFNSKPDFNDSKTLIIISVILTVGVSGIFFLHESFSGVALAMVLGVILNLLLVSKKKKKN